MIKGFSDLCVIGSGGFSVVYSAREDYVDRVVAIKVLSGIGADDAPGRDRFLREVRAMGRLSGIPHIVDVYQPTFTDLGQPCIVMPFMEGGNLAQLIAEHGPLSESAARVLAVALAGALATAHGRGIHHRDIKPENVLLDADGVAHLADFGIAVMADLQTGALTSATLSLQHAPPERVAPPSGELDEAAGDVYSLGSTLYTALAGRAPLGDPADLGARDFTSRVLVEPPPSIGRGDLDPAFESLILRCLHKDPAVRPTAQQLVAAFATLSDHMGLSPQAGHTVARHADPVSRTVPSDEVRIDQTPHADVKEGTAWHSGTTVREDFALDSVEDEAEPAVRTPSWRRAGLAGAVLLTVVVLAALAVSSRDTTGSAISTASTTPTSSGATAAGRQYEPVRIEGPVALSQTGGFSVKWTDPNQPAANLRFFIVEVDGARQSLPSESDDLTEREFIVNEVDFTEGSEPVDVSRFEYCVTIFVGDSPEGLVASDTTCIGPLSSDGPPSPTATEREGGQGSARPAG